MLDKIKALFAWRVAFESGVYQCQENLVNGKRRAVRISGGHSPINHTWLGRA